MKVTNRASFPVVAYGMVKVRDGRGPSVEIPPGETREVHGQYLGEMDGACHLAIIGEMICHDDPGGDRNDLVLLGEPLFIGNDHFQIHVFHFYDFLLLEFEGDVTYDAHGIYAVVSRSEAGKTIIEIGKPLLGLVAKRLEALIEQGVRDETADWKIRAWTILLCWVAQQHCIPVRHDHRAWTIWITWCRENALPTDQLLLPPRSTDF